MQATSDVEFVFEDKNHQFVISSSEDEVEEVISDDEPAEHRNESDEVHHEERIDEPDIQPEVHQEEHMDVNMENYPNENLPGSSRAPRDNHQSVGDADGKSGPEVENRPEVENIDARNGVDADDEDDDDLLVGDLPHYRSGPGDDFSAPSSSKPTNRERAWRETIELSSSDEEEPNPFARTARRPESLSQKLNPIYRKNLIPDRKSQKRSPPDSFESDEARSSSKKPNISSSVDSNRNSTRDDPCHHEAGRPSEVSSGSSFMPSSRVNNSKTPANQSDSESNEDQEIGEVGAILISDSEEEETEPIRESNIQSPIIIL